LDGGTMGTTRVGLLYHTPWLANTQHDA
jgi:hypothetical protein